jgi:hypothetical protein
VGEKMKNLLLLITICLFGIIGSSLLVSSSLWVNSFSDCPTTYQSQTCTGANRVCGYSGGLTYCNASAIIAPNITIASTTDQDGGTFNGGYLIDCYAYDGTNPMCDNSQAYWCDRNSTCYTTQQRNTNCTKDVFGVSFCGSCRTGFYNCYGDINCESTASSACTGSQNNHYTSSTCNDQTAGGTCVCDTNYFACDGVINETDGCEIHAGDSCGNTTGYIILNQCYSASAGNCTASGGRSGNRDCNNDDTDSNTLTCNGANGCEITAGTACKNSTTTGIGGTWQSGTCIGTGGNCTNTGGTTAWLDCDNSDGDGIITTCNTGNGCEIQNGSACIVGSLSGTYNSCTCTVSTSHFITGIEADYSTTANQNLLWGWDYGSGNLLFLRNNAVDSNISINASGCIKFNDASTQCTANSGSGFTYSEYFNQILNVSSYPRFLGVNASVINVSLLCNNAVCYSLAELNTSSGGGIDGNNYTEKIVFTNGTTVTLTLNRSGMPNLVAQFDNPDTWNTSEQMQLAVSGNITGLSNNMSKDNSTQALQIHVLNDSLILYNVTLSLNNVSSKDYVVQNYNFTNGTGLSLVTKVFSLKDVGVSFFTNNANYITIAVSTLTNYYLKQDSYNNTEIRSYYFNKTETNTNYNYTQDNITQAIQISGIITTSSNIATNVSNNNASTKSYVDSQNVLKVNRTGDTITGSLNVTINLYSNITRFGSDCMYNNGTASLFRSPCDK